MNLLYLLALVLVVIVLLFVHHYYRWRKLGIPGPIGYPIVGTTLEMISNKNRAYDYFMDNKSKYGTTWGMLLGPKELVVVLDPASCDHVLKKKWKNYERGPDRKRIFKELLGDGIFVANGEEWKFHRDMAKPLFRTTSIDNRMVPLFISHTHDVLSQFEEAAKKREPLEIVSVFMQFTMSTFLTLGLGCSKEMLSKEERLKFAAAFDYLQWETNSRGVNPFWWLFVSKKLKDNTQYVDEVVYRIIKERKKDDEESLKSKTDIFSAFLLERDQEGKPFTDTYLRDVFMNFLLAGRDTTAALLTWTFYELAKNPHIKEKIREEMKTVIKGEEPTAEDIHKLVYTKMVLTEVLRLHPSVPVDGREAVEDDVLPTGIKVNKGASVLYSPYVTGRSEEWYPDPLRFDPERWNETNSKNILPGQFTAFHWGPQTCLGKKMAYVEASVALVMILKNFDLQLADSAEKTYQLNIILLPENGLYMLPVFAK